MFVLLASFELVKLIYRIQASENYSFLLFNKQMFLFIKAKYFYYSFFNLSIEIFFLYLDKLLIRYKRYLVSLIVIAGLVLTSILRVASILGIRDNYIAARLIIKVNRFLAINTRDYLVSILFNIIS
jgi:hypothetical protein